MLDRVRGVVADLVVYPEQLRRNLDQTGGLWASEGILLALVDKGLGRQDAYVLVQRNAMKAFEGQGEFRELLQADAEIGKYLTAEEIGREFDLDHALVHVDTIIDRVLGGA
jgi:adenylosuccinate lyase